MPTLHDMRSLLDVLPDPAQVIDLDGRVVLANAKMRRLFGRTQGHQCFEVVSASGLECRNCPRNCRHDRFVDREVEVDTPDGRSMLVSHSTLELDGRPHILECYKDVTDHKRVARKEAELKAELDMARAIQQRCMAIDLGQAGIHYEYAYLPARTAGGDFLNAHVDRDGRVRIAVADVSGHGVAAATITLMLKMACDQVLMEDVPIEHVPQELNRRLYRYISPQHFVTFALVRLDLGTGTLEMINAGHPPVLICRPDSTTATALMADLPPLGVVEEYGSLPGAQSMHVGPGDRVVLYSDGAFQLFEDSVDMFAREVHRSLQLPVRDQVEHLLHGVRTGGDDDVTVFIAEIRGQEAGTQGPGGNEALTVRS